jgi:hypothetical protein
MSKIDLYSGPKKRLDRIFNEVTAAIIAIPGNVHNLYA